MAQLILIRHGQSLWNALNKFTGWVDVPLSERGRAEATIASCRLSDYRVNVCFTSRLIRAIETAMICLTERDDICGGKIPIIKHEKDDQIWHGWNSYDGDEGLIAAMTFTGGLNTEIFLVFIEKILLPQLKLN